MRWRDVRFEKPTEADLDHKKRVCMLFDDNSFGLHTLPVRDFVVAWCPTSELPAFDRIPDPPEGWTWADKSKPFDKRAKFWHQYEKRYVQQSLGGFSTAAHLIYIVPIDPPKPPEPQYRPFANAAEFEPYFGRMIKEKSLDDFRTVVTSFSDKGVWLAGGSIATGYREAFDIYEFANGFPFGVKVEP
jgi:hypothetical protein